MSALRFARSPRIARPILVATLPLIAPLARVIAQPAPGADLRASVAVVDFETAPLRDAAAWAPLGKGIAQILMTELAANRDLRIVERERIQAVLDELKLTSSNLADPATAARVGKLVGARYTVTGGAMIDPRNTIRLDVHGVRTETGVLEYADKLSGKADDVLELVARIGEKMSKAFDPTPFDAPSGSAVRPSRENLRLAMLLGNAIGLQDQRKVDSARVLVRQALAIAPENASAKALLTLLGREK